MMFRLSSERQLRLGFYIAVGALVVCGSIFYPLQNSAVLPGGQVAPVKLAWLASAILFWYLLPALLLLDTRLHKETRVACTVLLANMLVRAVIELILMYGTSSWHPWMGIGHDIFSFVLMLFFVMPVLRGPQPPYAGFLLVSTAMFIPEAFFAWYMLANATTSGATVYFVPDNPAHSSVLLVTALCVAGLIIFLVYFCRRWLYGQAEG